MYSLNDTLETYDEEVWRAIEQVHQEGLKVMLVPHLWVENGAWRAEIDPGDDAGWQRWTKGYQDFADHHLYLGTITPDLVELLGQRGQCNR